MWWCWCVECVEYPKKFDPKGQRKKNFLQSNPIAKKNTIRDRYNEIFEKVLQNYLEIFNSIEINMNE